MNLIFTPAYAQAMAPNAAGFDYMSLLPIALIFVVFYFFLIRPQQKKAQQQRELLAALKRGDRIVTTGGLIGEISQVINDQELQVEIAEGVRVRIARAMVADLISKTGPVSKESSPKPMENSKSSPVKKPAAPKKATKAPLRHKKK